jgi:hypothetical protein
MRILLLAGFVALGTASVAGAQIRVNPTGVNVNTQGATTVFLTFGGVAGFVPVEAIWCGALIPAAPDVGSKCDPGTIFGSLPARLNRSQGSGIGGFTDIMSIPPSVTRRAYQAAAAGENSAFFYVRRFVSEIGGPDQFVAVTCRLAGGGARVPFSLLDVRLSFEIDMPVLYVREGSTPPPLRGELAYAGTGRLKGRWEVVLPGEELPSATDLLTEASLPIEDRPLQREYTEVGRFNVFLPPGQRRFTLPGPDPRRLPTLVTGSYLVLMRIEATDDKEASSDLAAVGAGPGTVAAGAVAGFPLPTLQYIVGGAETAVAPTRPGGVTLVEPPAGARLDADARIEFSWTEQPGAIVYRLEIEDPQAQPVHAALVERGRRLYRAPSFLRERAAGQPLRWRVTAIDGSGREIERTAWREIRFVT